MRIMREPYGYAYAEKSRLKETYGGPEGQVFVECMRISPEEGESKTVILFSHPIGGGSFLPMVTALARAGRHVIYCNTRYRGNDTDITAEKQARIQLAQREAMLSSMLENLPVDFWARDKDGRGIIQSRLSKEHWGISAARTSTRSPVIPTMS